MYAVSDYQDPCLNIYVCNYALGSHCVENSIQLVGELSQHEGSPVICLGGGWVKICDVSTSATATAVVACRQLGFSIEGINTHAMICIFNPHHKASVCIQCHKLTDESAYVTVAGRNIPITVLFDHFSNVSLSGNSELLYYRSDYLIYLLNVSSFNS